MMSIPEKCNYNSLIKETLTNLYENFYKHRNTKEISLSDGVLTWKVSKVGDYVFNKQTPSQQLWVSSPINGPFRFDLKDCEFIHKKKNILFKDYLKKELEEIEKINK